MTAETKADPYAWKNTLALPLVGSSSDVSNSVNSGSTTKVISSGGDPAASSDTSNFYSGSFEFDGNDYLTIPNTTELTMGTGDFTVEFWYKVSSSFAGSNFYVFDFNSNGLRVQLINNTIAFATGSSLIQVTVNGADTNSWHHIACVRSSSTAILYYNGINVGTFSSTENITMGSTANIGRYAAGANYYSGYLQDFRVYKGIAKYTSNIVVPATSPDILPDTPSGVSGSSKLAKVTDGAVSFDGTDDRLIADIGSGGLQSDFCIEYWIYADGITGDRGHFQISEQTGGLDTSNTSLMVSWGNSEGDTNMYVGNANVTDINDPNQNNTWKHYAVVRNSGTLKLYVNGREAYSASNSVDMTSFRYVSISGYYSTSYLWKGFISNFRVVSGSPVYTSSFTPPTEPLTDVTNTKLLCCQSNSEGPQKTAVIPSVTGTAYAMWPVNSDINDDSGNSRNLSETGGSTSFVAAASNSFGITNAANFAKDGKYLSYAVTPASAWTLDGYIRLETTTTSAPYILGWNGTNGNDTTFGFPSDGSRKFNLFGSFGILDSGVVAEVGRWYHIRITSSGSTDCKLYVDGVLLTQSTSSNGGPVSPITFGDVQSGRFSGQVAGVRYTPTDLGAPPLGGETTSNGVTTNSPSVGVGLAGDVAATNFNPFITDINTVRGQETGYATFNPIYHSDLTLSDGNLKITRPSGSDRAILATPGVSSGKYYWETTINLINYHYIGVGESDLPADKYPGQASYPAAAIEIFANGQIDVYNGTIATGGNTEGNQGGTTGMGSGTLSGTPTIGVALDMDNKTLSYYNNSVLLPILTKTITSTNTLVPAHGIYTAGQGNEAVYNFGQKPFKFPPPAGFQPVNAANVKPETVIARPGQFVGTTIWSGNGGTQSINAGLKPDLVWIKSRTSADSHHLYDTIRGTARLAPANPNAEYNNSDFGSFDASGFTVINGKNQTNGSGKNYVGWSWKAGGNKNTFNVDDVGYASAADAGFATGGSNITPTGASVGTKQGFSIVTWDVGSLNGTLSLDTGLTKAPDFVITKAIDQSDDWLTFHKNLSSTESLILNGTRAKASNAAYAHTFNSNGTISGLVVPNWWIANKSYVFYSWHDVPGLQKFGKYTGNGAADGPFVELTFRPAWLMIKQTDAADGWMIYDNKRSTFNLTNKRHMADTDGQEYTGNVVGLDLLSNGFKIRTADDDTNGSNGTYIYAAFAESPTSNLFGAQSNAR